MAESSTKPLGVAQSVAAEAQARARRNHQARLRRRASAASASGMRSQPEPISPSQHAGAVAENQAWAYLSAQGCRLVARNLRCAAGEIDLIAWHHDTLLFVEVRWRRDPARRYGGALASVDVPKQRRLRRAAQFFLRAHWPAGRAVPVCRFDVVAIDGSQLRWVRGAFSG